jgi:hypothetical protein
MPIKDPVKRAEYQKQYHKRWYGRNRGNRVEQVRQRKRGIREWMREYKETLSCERCGLSGEDNAWALEFHHRDPETKIALVSTLVAAGSSKKKIMAEVEKCEVVCSNCHRKEHYAEHREAVENGEDSLWTKAGKAGAQNQVFNQDHLNREKRRRRKRRKQRAKEESGTKIKAGPERETDNDIDTFLRKIELGVELQPDEARRLRRLLKRQFSDKQMEGEIESRFTEQPDDD